MESYNEILDELGKISPLLAGIKKCNVFSIPEGYFIRFSENMSDKIKEDFIFNSELKKNNFSIPEGYFENLSESILNKVKGLQEDSKTELKSISPVLYDLQDKNIFTVPDTYFKNFPDRFTNLITPKSDSKVISIKKRNFVWKYAVAAAMTGIIGISSLMVYNKGDQSKYPLNETYKIASQYKNEQQINDGISKLSDDDIIKYLEKTGTDADNQTLTTNIDESELPAQKDYLKSDKTLDEYLDQPDTENANN